MSVVLRGQEGGDLESKDLEEVVSPNCKGSLSHSIGGGVIRVSSRGLSEMWPRFGSNF